jgi:hypothetical protein
MPQTLLVLLFSIGAVQCAVHQGEDLAAAGRGVGGNYNYASKGGPTGNKSEHAPSDQPAAGSHRQKSGHLSPAGPFGV